MNRKKIIARLFIAWLFSALLAEPGFALELSGQYTNLLFETRDSLKQDRTTDLNRLRLEADGDYGHVRFHLAYDHELLWGGLVADPVLAAVLRQPDPTWLDTSATISRRTHFNWRHDLYRGWVEYAAGQVRVKLGRQRIAWGSGRIWNPTDRFNPVQPTALEPNEKLGVDAGRIEWNYAGNGSLIAVAAPARPSSRTSRKLAFRWQDTFGEFDLALMAGRINNENMFGVDITGNMGDAGVQLEWMQARNPLEGGYGQLSAGIDYTWYPSWFPNGLYMALEYFYNGAAGSPRFKQDRLNGRSNHLLGSMLGYDLTPLWRIDLLLIADLQQSGWFITPSITWSADENVDIRFFAQLPQGSGTTEFSVFEPLYAVRADWYF
ncbi:MAG: hypothetical protein Q9M08_07500 [Mariprofundus sp.]|nr:hypothetical protein [Mariprofundus sp.]